MPSDSRSSVGLWDDAECRRAIHSPERQSAGGEDSEPGRGVVGGTSFPPTQDSPQKGDEAAAGSDENLHNPILPSSSPL